MAKMDPPMNQFLLLRGISSHLGLTIGKATIARVATVAIDFHREDCERETAVVCSIPCEFNCVTTSTNKGNSYWPAFDEQPTSIQTQTLCVGWRSEMHHV